MKFILSLLLFVALIVKTESIASEAPQEIIVKIFELAKTPDILKNEALKNEIDALINFEKMSKSILGNYVSKIDTKDVKWFEVTIKEIITKTVYPEAPEFLKGVKITYRTALIDNDKATIPSVVSKKGERTDVSYKLEKNNQNQWRIVDISIDDESWVRNINSSITKTFNEKGWTGIKDLLNKKVKELNSPKAKKVTKN